MSEVTRAEVGHISYEFYLGLRDPTDFIDQPLKEGAAPKTAIIDGAKGRFRPIMLTSVTTFLGFTPLILERAIQAQFLVPFAASLGIGIMIATAILILLVPALMTIYLRANSRRRTAVAAEPQQTSTGSREETAGLVWCSAAERVGRRQGVVSE